MLNDKIKNRKLYSGFDESTYYTQELFEFVVDNISDPDILFKLKIYGMYAKKYKWNKEQADKFIKDHLEESRGYFVNDIWYAYDWGSGENRITKEKMHEPNLDHVIPRERGGPDTPENMRIRSRRLNENKGNTNLDIERIATIEDMLNDMESETDRNNLLKRLIKQYNIL